MKTLPAAFALLSGLFCLVPVGALAAGTANSVCLEAGSIDHTVVVDDQTILYYMHGQKIWKNTLHTPCSGLKFERAFSEDIRGQVCANAQMIQVFQTGTRCMLGDFTPYTPPAKTSAP